MKKTLLALAVLAVSGAAFAQSSVTLYGVADLGLVKATGASAQMTGNGVGNNGNSRFGMKGTEDLGGGLKANFNFEAAINAETGATDANMFQRNAWASVSGGFGEVRLGRGLSLGFNAAAAHELTGTANYSSWANTFGFVGGTRNNSEFRYTTPQFVPGLTVGIGYIMKPDNLVGAKAATATAAAVPGVETSKVDFAVIYAAGPIGASAAYSKPSGGEKSFMVGGSYNLGVAKIAASYQDPAGVSKGGTIGVSAPFGPASVALDVARDTGLKSTNFVVEGKYNLSKRTFTYAAVQRNGAAKVTTSSIGLRHNF